MNEQEFSWPQYKRVRMHNVSDVSYLIPRKYYIQMLLSLIRYFFDCAS